MSPAIRCRTLLPWLAAIATLLLSILMPQSARAQGPQGHIAYVYPAGGQQGQTVEATVGGIDLDSVKGVRITGDGVTAKVLKVDKGKSVTISVTIASDAPLEQRDLRLVTSGGLTNRARFFVGQLPEVMEKEPNSDRAAAQTLPTLPVVVNGQIFEGDKDLFRFSAKAGQTIVCQTHAQQVLPFLADGVPGWFQAVLTLYNADGNIVAHADHFRFHPDPVLIHKVERDGEYTVEIKDSLFRGREDFVYRLSIGELPFLTHVYPLGGRRQTTAHVALLGVNLPREALDVRLGDDSPGVQQVDVSGDGVISNSLPLAIGQCREIDEREPNNSMERAQPIEPPMTVNGRIQTPGDVDYFVFKAEAQQKLVMEVHARRLESPLDSVLAVLDAKGQQVAQNDDYEDETMPQMTHHADSRLIYTFRFAGKHYLRIGDIQGKGGQEFAYRLTVAPPRPDFELRVTPDNPRVGQGATVVLSVSALRRDGFDGQIDLSVANLPKGFTTVGAAIPAGEKESLVTLTAPADVSLGAYTPSIKGKAVIDGRTVTHSALPVEDAMQAFIYHHLLPTQEMLLAVLEPVPFRLIPQMPPEGYIRFGAGRTAFLVVKVERKARTRGPIRLTLSNPPKGVRMQPVAIPAGQTEAKVEIRIPNQLPGDVRYNLIIAGTVQGGKEPLTTITPAILALGPSAKPPAVAKPATKLPPP